RVQSAAQLVALLTPICDGTAAPRPQLPSESFSDRAAPPAPVRPPSVPGYALPKAPPGVLDDDEAVAARLDHKMHADAMRPVPPRGPVVDAPPPAETGSSEAQTRLKAAPQAAQPSSFRTTMPLDPSSRPAPSSTVTNTAPLDEFARNAVNAAV